MSLLDQVVRSLVLEAALKRGSLSKHVDEFIKDRDVHTLMAIRSWIIFKLSR